MRIFHPITRLVRGGAQLNTLMCCEEQAFKGYHVVLASGLETGPEGSYLEEARAQPFTFVEVPDLVREVDPVRDVKALLQLYRIIREHDFDIIHTHTSKAGILGRWAAFLAGKRAIVHTPHGNVFYGYFSRTRELVFRFIEWLSALITVKLVMLSEGDRQDHLRARICGDDKLVIIPSGVPIEHFAGPTTDEDRRQLAELALPADRLLVGTVARLVEVKGVVDLVHAFARVAERLPKAYLVLVGDGPDRNEVERLVREYRLEDSVRITGRLDDVRPVLRALDLFVMASRNEGMGRAVVEALAAGLPVVATRVGGLPDVVCDQVGRLVPPQDAEAMAGAIVELLGDPEGLQRMGAAAPRWAENFSAEIMFESLDRLYAEVLAATSPKG